MCDSSYRSGYFRRMNIHVTAFLCAFFFLMFSNLAFGQEKPKAPDASKKLTLPFEVNKWTGDFDGMVKRRVIRVLVAQSKTYYFVDKGVQKGSTYEAMKAFEDFVNKKLKTKNIKVHVVFIPVFRDDLVPALREGRGDIAAAGLTVTQEREKLVDFSIPIADKIDEIPVTSADGPAIENMADLSGKEIFVRKSSSYYEHLERINEQFKQEGKPPITLRTAPEEMETEDILEMANAGLVKITVADSHLVDLWKQIYTQIIPRPGAAVNTGGKIAWMFRQESPKLEQTVNEFLGTYKKSVDFAVTLKKYFKSTKIVKNATSPEEIAKFEKMVQLFKKYGDQYEMDYLLMMAQGYQESRLDQNAKSPVGAVGVMQVMPATGKELKVGNISELDSNIHAGVKYIRFMIDQYYAKEPMDPVNKGLFAFASYNAGPGRIKQLRKTAREEGLDPNVWFNNVEIIASEKIGRETVTYVSNIFKYYIAYKIVMEQMQERSQAKEQLKKNE
jgi:membrane-bound lytic murein transglycosylase MltF